jgi:ABC-2 type transport system ATP-binding protein
MSTAPDLLRISALAKHFAGGNGISNVSLSVPPGSVTGFIGVNGAGKSTTLRCVMGLLRPDAGEVLLFGGPANRHSRSRVGFLPEERGLFPHERARDAIAFHGRLKGMRRRDALATADRLLERIGLGSRRRDRLATLSKGNAQRVQVLCALVHEPQLLLLDEPLSGLDPVAQADMLSLLAEFRGRGGAVLFSTHSMASAEKVCDRVAILSGGCTVFEGAVPDAAALSPHGAEVVTAEAKRLAVAAESVGGHVVPLAGGIGEAGRWRVVLPRHVTHPALVRALAEHGVPFFNFQPIEPSLESAFWQLAEPRTTKSRAA